MQNDDDAPEVSLVAAESLDTTLRYKPYRHHDFIITEAFFQTKGL